MLHYFDLFLVLCNLGTKTTFRFWEVEQKDTHAFTLLEQVEAI